MPATLSTPTPLRITAYFDFMCPWSYLGRARLIHALQKTRVPYELEWVPFELYTHNTEHRVQKEKIIGHAHFNTLYQELHPLGLRENIQIFHPKYEASSKRALTGYLYAHSQGVGEKYLDEIFSLAFEHTMDISSFAVLRRAALKLGLNAEAFLLYIQDEKNHARVEEYTRLAKLNGVRGVPAYYFNHFPVTGALPVDDIIHIIHAAQKNSSPAFMVPEKKTIRLPRVAKKKTLLKRKKKARASATPHTKKKPSSRARAVSTKTRRR